MRAPKMQKEESALRILSVYAGTRIPGVGRRRCANIQLWMRNDLHRTIMSMELGTAQSIIITHAGTMSKPCSLSHFFYPRHFMEPLEL